MVYAHLRRQSQARIKAEWRGIKPYPGRGAGRGAADGDARRVGKRGANSVAFYASRRACGFYCLSLYYPCRSPHGGRPTTVNANPMTWAHAHGARIGPYKDFRRFDSKFACARTVRKSECKTRSRASPRHSWSFRPCGGAGDESRMTSSNRAPRQNSIVGVMTRSGLAARVLRSEHTIHASAFRGCAERAPRLDTPGASGHAAAPAMRVG
jgi:hypothetical protein